jgi:hypothetical protein
MYRDWKENLTKSFDDYQRSAWGNLASFTIFYSNSNVLANKKDRLRLNRYDLLADTIKERCGTAASVFQSVMEADLLLA